jgi:hypothetical protein
MFKEIKNNLKKSINEAPELPAAEIQGRVYPEVLITDLAPDGLKAAVGPDRVAYLIGKDPLKIQIPNVKGIFKVEPSDIVFEAAGSYEKAFRAAMKKYGLSSLSDLDTPAEKKGFYNFVDKVWHSKEEKDKGEEKGTHKEMEVPTGEIEEELPLYSDHNKRHKTEVSPPARKNQVKGIKKHMAQGKGKDKIPKTYVDKKTGKRKETNPWALAWAQYDKYGKPSSGPDKDSKTMKKKPKK